jgi:hypothetical protein
MGDNRSLDSAGAAIESSGGKREELTRNRSFFALRMPEAFIQDGNLASLGDFH